MNLFNSKNEKGLIPIKNPITTITRNEINKRISEAINEIIYITGFYHANVDIDRIPEILTGFSPKIPYGRIYLICNRKRTRIIVYGATNTGLGIKTKLYNVIDRTKPMVNQWPKNDHDASLMLNQFHKEIAIIVYKFLAGLLSNRSETPQINEDEFVMATEDD